MSSEPPPRPSRERLTRERIAREGLGLVDEQPAAELSMRRLAGRLGVDPMALYRHVANKDDLVRAMSDVVLGEVLGDGSQPGADDLVTAAVRLHEHLVAHPGRLSIVAGAATTVSSAVFSIRAVQALTARGVPEEVAVAALRAVVSYVLGSALLTVSERDDDGADVDPREVAARLARGGRPVDVETVTRMLRTGLGDFRVGLDALLRSFLGPA